VILVDSNVLIDILTRDALWADWSREALADACDYEGIVLNQIVVAEVAPAFASLAAFETWIAPLQPSYLDLTNDAAFCGGGAFLEHRRKRKTGVDSSKAIVADFLIGGHAQTLGATILTRDPRFYRTYFPTVPLIAPIKDDHD
jgi:predicted nucleic acid-binding protein